MFNCILRRSIPSMHTGAAIFMQSFIQTTTILCNLCNLSVIMRTARTAMKSAILLGLKMSLMILYVLLAQNANLEGQKGEGFDIVPKMKGSVGFNSVVYVVKLDIPKGLAQNLLASLSFR